MQKKKIIFLILKFKIKVNFPTGSLHVFPSNRMLKPIWKWRKRFSRFSHWKRKVCYCVLWKWNFPKRDGIGWSMDPKDPSGRCARVAGRRFLTNLKIDARNSSGIVGNNSRSRGGPHRGIEDESSVGPLTSETKVYVYLVARYDEIKRERTWRASVHFQKSSPWWIRGGTPSWRSRRYVNGTDYYLIPPNCRPASGTGVKPLKNCRFGPSTKNEFDEREPAERSHIVPSQRRRSYTSVTPIHNSRLL